MAAKPRSLGFDKVQKSIILNGAKRDLNLRQNVGMCATPPNGNGLHIEMNINTLLFSYVIPFSDKVNWD